jgi:GNAT superfamily N-acetyltransferase
VQASASEKIAAIIDFLPESQLESAQALVRLAFGTHLQMPDPTEFGNGSSCTARWYMDPEGVFGAWRGAELIGVVFAINWGTFGFFGPLVINPEYWGRGIAQQLLERVMAYFQDRKVTHSGLFTFSNSPKHILLYQRYGFEPRFLTALASAPTQIPQHHRQYQCYSDSSEVERSKHIEKLRAITDSLYPGLDLTVEIDNVCKQQIGETIIHFDARGQAQGFAICHFGNRSEAQRGAVYVKFAAATGSDAFAAVLDSCHHLGAASNLVKVDLGMNTSRKPAYKLILGKGFRPQSFGVAMEINGQAGFNRSDVFAADDWR